MNQQIDILREPDEILGVSGVSGKHYGMSSKVDAVAQRRFDDTMINQERRYLDAPESYTIPSSMS